MNSRLATAIATIAAAAAIPGFSDAQRAYELARGRRLGWDEPRTEPYDRHGFTWPPITPERHESNRQLALSRDIKRINNKTAKRQAKADGCKCWKHERRRLKGVR